MPAPKKSAKKKASVGGGSVRIAQKFNLKRALPIIAVMTLVGGLFVFRSFAGSAEAEVTKWYRTCLNREPDAGGLSYWSGEVSKLGVNAAALKFAAHTGVTSCDYPNVSKTSASPKAPTTSTSTTATTQSTTSTTSAATTSADPLKDAQAWTVLGTAHVANAKKENGLTYQISLKNPVLKSDLSSIAQKEGYVRGAISQMQGGKSTVQGLYNQAISKSATKAQGPAILSEVDKIQGHIQSLSAYATNIAADYKRAEATHEANLNFFGALGDQSRKDADCRSRGGTPTWTGGCNEPPVIATGGSGGSSSSGQVGSEAVPDMPAGITQQQKIDFARSYCNSKPSYEITREITGGSRGEIRDVYHQASNTWCNNRLERVTWITCDSAYRVSENANGTIKVCVKEKAVVNESDKSGKAYSSLPNLPYPVCGVSALFAKGVRCIRNYDYKNMNWSDKQSWPAVTMIEHCKRYVAFGIKKDNDCKVVYGLWKYPT